MYDPPSLPPIIRALLSPGAYDHPVDGGIKLIQTHISYVLLAGPYAYKIKKPLDLGFLDYSTLEKRHRMCHEEVRLNRRLCDQVYVGVVAITTRDGAFRIIAEGQAVEYAVKMRRVPSERQMPVLLERGLIGSSHVEALARLVADFHAHSGTNERIAGFGRPDAIRENWYENFSQVAPYRGRTIDSTMFDAVRAYVESTVAHRATLLHRRADSRHVRDCHGDLRTDAVVFQADGSICVMDCIEFNDRLRFGDVASDIGFLAMDLDFRGFGELSDELMGAYLAASSDETLPLVLPFYKSYRAFVRGKVESLLLDESEVPPDQRRAAAERAGRYFALAHRYATMRMPQTVVVMVGLTGSGKSHLANALACRLGAAILSTDALRDEVSARATDRESYGEGRYAEEQRLAVYEAMRSRAAGYLDDGDSVILDGTHIQRAERERAYALARSGSVRLLVIRVTADDDATRRHLQARESKSTAASEGRWEIYAAQRQAFEPLDEVPGGSLISVEGDAPLAENVQHVLAALD